MQAKSVQDDAVHPKRKPAAQVEDRQKKTDRRHVLPCSLGNDPVEGVTVRSTAFKWSKLEVNFLNSQYSSIRIASSLMSSIS